MADREELDITRDDRVDEALKQKEYRDLLVEYRHKINDPASRKKYEEEMVELEKKCGIEVTFVNLTPGYVIKTSVGGDKLAFINICSSEVAITPSCKVTKQEGSESRQWELPHFMSPPRDDMSKKGLKCTVYDVIFHPDALQLASLHRPFRKMIHEAACDAVESTFNVALDKTNLKFPKLSYKGCVRPACIRKKISSFKTEHDPETDKLYDKFYKMYDEHYDNNEFNNKPAGQYSVTPIQDYVTPKYHIRYRNDIGIQEFPYVSLSNDNIASIPKELIVEIFLPLLKSSVNFILDVRSKWLKLVSEKPSKYKLKIALPYKVLEENGQAKFETLNHILVITLPVNPTAAPTVLEVNQEVSPNNNYHREDSEVKSDHSPLTEVSKDKATVEKTPLTEELTVLFESECVIKSKTNETKSTVLDEDTNSVSFISKESDEWDDISSSNNDVASKQVFRCKTNKRRNTNCAQERCASETETSEVKDKKNPNSAQQDEFKTKAADHSKEQSKSDKNLDFKDSSIQTDHNPETDNVYNAFYKKLYGHYDNQKLNNKPAGQGSVTPIHDYVTPLYRIRYRCDIGIQDFANKSLRKEKFKPIPKEMIVEIYLPRLKSPDNYDLNVGSKSLKIVSEKPYKYKLEIALPYEVLYEKGSAKFKTANKELVLTLPINRTAAPTVLEVNQDVSLNNDYHREDSGVKSDHSPLTEVSKDKATVEKAPLTEELTDLFESKSGIKSKTNETKSTFLDEDTNSVSFVSKESDEWDDISSSNNDVASKQVFRCQTNKRRNTNCAQERCASETETSEVKDKKNPNSAQQDEFKTKAADHSKEQSKSDKNLDFKDSSIQTEDNPETDYVYNAFYKKLYGHYDNQKLNNKPAGQGSVKPIPDYVTPLYRIRYRCDIGIQDFANKSLRKEKFKPIPKEMIVEIYLPQLKSPDNYDLNVGSKSLKIVSEKPYKYKLEIALPYEVLYEKGSAKFKTANKELVLTLPINRTAAPTVLEVNQDVSLNNDYHREDSGVKSDHSPLTEISEDKATVEKTPLTEELTDLFESKSGIKSKTNETKSTFLDEDTNSVSFVSKESDEWDDISSSNNDVASKQVFRCQTNKRRNTNCAQERCASETETSEVKDKKNPNSAQQDEFKTKAADHSKEQSKSDKNLDFKDSSIQTEDNPETDYVYNAFYKKLYGHYDNQKLNNKPAGQGSVKPIPDYVTPLYRIRYRCDIGIQDFANKSLRKEKFKPIPKEMIVEIYLPQLKSPDNYDLNVGSKSLKIVSEKPYKYKLEIALPYEVLYEKGSAKFKTANKELVLTLPINRTAARTVLEVNQEVSPNNDYHREDSGVKSDHSPLTEVLKDKTTVEKAPLTEKFTDLFESKSGIKSKTKEKSLFTDVYVTPSHSFRMTKTWLYFTLIASNVDPLSIVKTFDESHTLVQIKFRARGRFFRFNYAFCIKFYDFVLDVDKVVIKRSNNCVVVEIPNNKQEPPTSYYVGTDENSLEMEVITRKNKQQERPIEEYIFETETRSYPFYSEQSNETDTNDKGTLPKKIDLKTAKLVKYSSYRSHSPPRKNILKPRVPISRSEICGPYFQQLVEECREEKERLEREKDKRKPLCRTSAADHSNEQSKSNETLDFKSDLTFDSDM